MFSRERGDVIINLRASLDTSKDKLKLPEGLLAVFQMENGAVVFKCNARIASLGCFQTLLSSYWDVCRHVNKRLSEGRVRSETNCVAVPNKAEDEVSHFLRSLVLLIRKCVEKNYSCSAFC